MTFPATVMIPPEPPDGPVELLLLQPASISPAAAMAPVVKTAISARFSISSLLELMIGNGTNRCGLIVHRGHVPV
jgi:hypothetical protein